MSRVFICGRFSRLAFTDKFFVSIKISRAGADACILLLKACYRLGPFIGPVETILASAFWARCEGCDLVAG